MKADALDTLLLSILFVGIIALAIFSVLGANQGVFTYALDDAYIHLAVAEELASSGNYGVNPGEVAAPCSSPLWVFLLVPFASLPNFTLAPLLLNVACVFLTGLVALGRMRLLLGRGENSFGPALLRVVVVLGFLFATNAFGLLFTGMEHSLQVLLAVLVVEGMVRIVERSEPGLGFNLAVVIGPWVRYENLALTLAAVLLCLALGRWRRGLVLGATAALGLALFSWYLVSLGLAPVPASITSKSPFLGGEPLDVVIHKFKHSFNDGRGTLVALGVALLSGFALASRGPRAWRVAAACLALAGLLHMGVGSYGWANRYEIYILAALIYGGASILVGAQRPSGLRAESRLAWGLLPWVIMIGFPYHDRFKMLPIAANNAYEQHHQMHRFVTEFWEGPVAVNDLGRVSFRNDHHVLDLWGLASPRALEARLGREGPEWMEHLADRYEVDLAMIYAGWFPRLPSQWKRIGTLDISGRAVFLGGRTVSFFATSPGAATRLKAELERFKPTLPRPELLSIEP